MIRQRRKTTTTSFDQNKNRLFYFNYFSSNPPGFAFVLYKYGEDADAAVRSKSRGKMLLFFWMKIFSFLDMDGRYVRECELRVVFKNEFCSVVCGQRVRVEHAKARSVNSRGGPSYGGYRGE